MKDKWYHKFKGRIVKQRKDRYKTDKNYRDYYKRKANDYRLKNHSKVMFNKRKWFLKNKELLATRARIAKRKIIQNTLKRLGGKCYKCGYDKLPALQFHHIGKKLRRGMDYLCKNYDVSNLMLLCANCHCLVHQNDKSRKF